MSTAKKILYVSIFDIVSKTISGVTTIFLIRILSQEEYALYTNFTTVYSFLGGFVFFSLNYSLVRISAEYISIHNKKPLDLYTFSVILQLLLYLLIFLIVYPNADLISNLVFQSDKYTKSIRLSLFAAFSLILFNINLSILQSQEDFKKYNYTNLIKNLLFQALLTLILLFSKVNFEKVAFALTISQLIVSFYIILPLLRYMKNRSLHQTFNRKWNLFLSYISENKYLILYFILLEILSKIDIFMLSRYSSAHELANYGVAQKYYYIFLQMLASIHTVLLPKFSKVEMRDKSIKKRFAIKWIKITSIVGAILIISYFLFKDLYILLNTPAYTYSYKILFPFMFSVIQGITLSPLVNILIANKEYKFLAVVVVFAILFSCVASYTAAKYGNAVWVATAYMLSHAIVNLSVSFKVILNR
ncbi:MAG: oligosaccharide flippase family protein [Thermodesulfovibrio sp.]|nr:oligosaccharide flippase family protein [Thermodesulfovibrio sp.]